MGIAEYCKEKNRMCDACIDGHCYLHDDLVCHFEKSEGKKSVCQMCGLPPELCVCEEIAREKKKNLVDARIIKCAGCGDNEYYYGTIRSEIAKIKREYCKHCWEQRYFGKEEL